MSESRGAAQGSVQTGRAQWWLIALVGVLAVTVVVMGAALIATARDGDDRAADEQEASADRDLFEEEEAPSEESTPSFAPNLGDKALEVGEPRVGSLVRTSLVEVRYPMSPGLYREAEAGNVWFGFRIEQCLDETADEQVLGTFNGEWAVVTPSGDEYSGNGSSWDDWPAPKYPEHDYLIPGRCLKGWMAIEVPKGINVASVLYRSDGVAIAEWLP